MVFKGLIAAAAAAALAVTPVVASAQGNSPQNPPGNSGNTPADDRAQGQPFDGDEAGSTGFFRGGFVIPFLVIIVIILAIYVFIEEEEEEPPVTP